jgi:ribonuclease PH
VLTDKGAIVEIQGTAEGDPFSEAQFQALMVLARKGIGDLARLQREVIGA